MNLLSALRTGLLVALASAAVAGAVEPTYSRSKASDRVIGPGDSARPGEMLFAKGVAAVRKNDYSFAIDMYRAAASWAYKPAQYNLGVIYATGEGGIAVDKPLALAWLALAAERGDADYAEARELVYATMNADEFAQANVLWREMRKTYGDEVALKRAKERWKRVRSEATGSRVGATGALKVGGRDTSGRSVVSSAQGVTGAGSVDGSIAYRDLRATDNPYDPKLRDGNADVGDIIPVKDRGKRVSGESSGD